MVQRRFDAPERQSLTSRGVNRRDAAGFEMRPERWIRVEDHSKGATDAFMAHRGRCPRRVDGPLCCQTT